MVSPSRARRGNRSCEITGNGRGFNGAQSVGSIGRETRTSEHRLVSYGENRRPALRYGMWFATCVLAPALSEGALGATVRRSRPTPCRQPEHRSHQTRSAVAASFARCIIVDSYYWQSGGAGSGSSPDKAGANCKEKKELFGLVMVQVRRTPVVPVARSVVCRSDLGSSLLGALCAVLLFEKFISLLGIIYMSILRCVFLYRETGRCCRSRTASISGLDRKIFPVKTGVPRRPAEA